MGSLFSINSPLWNLTNKMLQFLHLSILWLLCSIPIITIGASTTALYTVAFQLVRNEEGYITSSFFHALRQNFKQSTSIWLILLVIGLTFGIDLVVYSRLDRIGFIPMLLMTLFFSLFLAFIFLNTYIYPLLAKFHNSIPRSLLNALIMSVRHWPSSVSMLVIFIIILLIEFFLFPPLLLVTPALIAYINARILTKVFGHYTPTI